MYSCQTFYSSQGLVISGQMHYGWNPIAEVKLSRWDSISFSLSWKKRRNVCSSRMPQQYVKTGNFVTLLSVNRMVFIAVFSLPPDPHLFPFLSLHSSSKLKLWTRNVAPKRCDFEALFRTSLPSLEIKAIALSQVLYEERQKMVK